MPHTSIQIEWLKSILLKPMVELNSYFIFPIVSEGFIRTRISLTVCEGSVFSLRR